MCKWCFVFRRCAERQDFPRRLHAISRANRSVLIPTVTLSFLTVIGPGWR